VILCSLQINGVDVREAEHVQVVELLTGSERFVRLSVERKITSPTSSTFPSDFGLPATPTSASAIESSGKGVSPKVFGLPKPYTGLYSASSYMANRPSYMRTREPGQVRKVDLSKFCSLITYYGKYFVLCHSQNKEVCWFW